MSEFDNLYLCPKCDYVGSITDDKLECENVHIKVVMSLDTLTKELESFG